jgi:DNA-binding transcriptional LysR family regulator
MELRHLRTFVAVAEGENVSRAAQKLHVSQPALSRQIKDLEDELDVLLLEHGAKSVRLTEAGKLFLGEARAVLARADVAVRKLHDAVGKSHSELHIGYAPSLTVQILPGALRAFQAELPRVRVLLRDLTTEEMRTQLLEKKLDLALMVSPNQGRRRGFHVEGIAQYPFCIALPLGHPLARLRSISASRIQHEPFVAYTKADYPDYHEELTRNIGEHLQVVEEHDGGASLIAAVEAGHGVAMVPSCLSCFSGQRLKLIPLKPAPAPLLICAVYRSEAASAALLKFVAFAKEVGKTVGV